MFTEISGYSSSSLKVMNRVQAVVGLAFLTFAAPRPRAPPSICLPNMRQCNAVPFSGPLFALQPRHLPVCDCTHKRSQFGLPLSLFAQVADQAAVGSLSLFVCGASHPAQPATATQQLPSVFSTFSAPFLCVLPFVHCVCSEAIEWTRDSVGSICNRVSSVDL